MAISSIGPQAPPPTAGTPRPEPDPGIVEQEPEPEPDPLVGADSAASVDQEPTAEPDRPAEEEPPARTAEQESRETRSGEAGPGSRLDITA